MSAGIIEKSKSWWSSPVEMVEKKEAGAKRMCADLTAVNTNIKGDAYPMPNQDDLIDGVGDAGVVSNVDMLSGNYQVRVDPGDKDKTAFVTKDGLFCFDRMPFGLKNAGATFQRVTNEVLEGLPYAGVYVDDILIWSKDMESHLEHLNVVLTKLSAVNMKVKAK